ncbi:MAG TPA: ribonuclease Z [Pyrinomonadaceae bacterium]|nr:ribonuclease Z [Pyrinomonadaceae bacterium]
MTFLGTSAGVPTRARNVSCVGLRLPQRGEVWLFDCGEGTQHQLLRSELNISQITRVFVTHLHGDHVYGLMGLLATCGMSGHARGITVYGPRGLEEYVREVSRRTQLHTSYPLEVVTVETGRVFEDAEFAVECAPLKHRLPAFGYRVSEKDRTGHFDVEKAKAAGIPPGPLYGRLKRGERVTLEDGRTFDGADLCGPTLRGRSVVYCTDTIYCRAAVELSRGADLLVHEATFAERDEHLAVRSQHSTARMAARVALEAGARRLVITHFSPRYFPGNEVEPRDLLREARDLFPETEMAHDFLTVAVPREGDEADGSGEADGSETGGEAGGGGAG